MMRNRRAKGWIWLLMCLLLTGGCGGRPSIPEPPREEKRVKVPESLEMGGSVIRVADSAGGWKFEAKSKRATAAGMDGPYVLMPMEGRYEARNKPPVLMRADRAEVDEAGKRVTLLGSVWVSFGRSQLEADRVEYDLATGKVVAEGRTKWTFAEGGARPE
jgi:hypothetical protein